MEKVWITLSVSFVFQPFLNSGKQSLGEKRIRSIHPALHGFLEGRFPGPSFFLGGGGGKDLRAL